MKIKRSLALFLSLIMSLFVFSLSIYSETALTLTVTPSLSQDSEVELGDEITYTVSITNNSGIAGGTLFFSPSANLEYVRASLKGQPADAEVSSGAGNEGAYGIRFMGDIFAEDNSSFCSITFRVVGMGEAKLNFHTYQLTNGAEFLTPIVSGENISHKVKDVTKPNIFTSELPEVVKGYAYSFALEGDYPDFLLWQITNGGLPSGITFTSNGKLEGTPSEHGEFKFTVTATLLNELVSEPKEFTLTVLEKPRKLELTSESKYEITDNGYLTGVKARTRVSDIVSAFKNSEHVKVFDSKGNDITSSTSFVGTGFTVSLMHADEKVHTVTVVIKGDVSGDGQINIVDCTQMVDHIFGRKKFEGALLMAGLINDDSNINVLDYTKMIDYICRGKEF